MTRDASAPKPLPPLLPRPRIAGWASAPGVGTWVLVAGPGWGKTAAARLIADALALPQHWLEASADALAELAQALAPRAPLSPEVLARLLSTHLRDRHPGGATLVVDGAERMLRDPALGRFLRAWLAQAAPPLRTVVTSRHDLCAPLARQFVEGTAALLDVEALRLTEQEVRTWLSDRPAALPHATDLAGWPLGIAALAKGGAPPRAEHLLKALLEEELLAPLPAGLREAAIRLSLFATPSAEALPVLDVAPEQAEALRCWGLLAGEPPTWHPLARHLLRAEWHRTRKADEKADEAQRAARWLASRDLAQAVDLLDEAGLEEAAVALLHAQAPELRYARRFDLLGSLLARFAPRRADDPRLILIDGFLQEAMGYAGEARARFRAAAERFERLGDRPRQLEALNQLMRLAFQSDDFAAFEALEAVAEPLLPDGEVRDRVEHLNLLGCHRYTLGDEVGACRHFLAVLDLPHFGQITVAANLQTAATNLGILEMNRGELVAAAMHFRHALTLGEAFRFRRPTHRRVTLYLAQLALLQGERVQSERLYKEQAADLLPHDRTWPHWQLLQQEGDCLLLLGELALAEAKYDEALAILSAGGGAQRIDVDVILGHQAILRRRRGELRAALALHAQSLGSTGPWPRQRAHLLLEWGMTLLAAKAETEALVKLEAARNALAGRPARLLELDLSLVTAVALERAGRHEAAGHMLASSVALIRELGVLYAPLALREISEALWGMLLAHGHQDLVAEIASQFPDEAAAVRDALVRDQGASGAAVPPLAPPAVRIRCFGNLEVTLGSASPVPWPRKKAKALLGLLLFAPRGLSRETLGDLLGEHGTAQPERHLHDLSSALRKALEPSLGPREPSRYLSFKDGWYRLDLKDAWWDVAEFERAHAEGKRAWAAGDREAAVAAFEAAVALYQADLLSESSLLEFFEAERQHYRALTLEMLLLLSAHHLAGEHVERGRAYTERLLQLDPTCEEAHRRLMALYGRFGQRELVRQQYAQCVRVLRQAFDAAPSDETRALRDRLLQA